MTQSTLTVTFVRPMYWYSYSSAPAGQDICTSIPTTPHCRTGGRLFNSRHHHIAIMRNGRNLVDYVVRPANRHRQDSARDTPRTVCRIPLSTLKVLHTCHRPCRQKSLPRRMTAGPARTYSTSYGTCNKAPNNCQSYRQAWRERASQ